MIGALGVAAAILATAAERFVPEHISFTIGADAVDSILGIIASSMLAVTTFSVSVMTSAYGSATSNVTPRATRLLMEDSVTQNVLSTFIGSFLFSIVGIVVSKAGVYGPNGRAVLFMVTIGVIVLVVVSLLRWIDHLTRLGRVGETTDRVEQAARAALEARLQKPCFGGHPLRNPAAEIPEAARAVPSASTGYLQYVDIGMLSEWAESAGSEVFLAVIPGAFVYPGTTLAWITAASTDREGDKRMDDVGHVREAFSIGRERSFDQDPRFGFAVLSEIASRALSPAYNDSGTAIDVIGRIARLLVLWAEGTGEIIEDKVDFPLVHVPLLTSSDLLDDSYRAIARDGADKLEVQMRLQKALGALGNMGEEAFRAAVREQARLALARAEAAMALEDDKVLLRAAAAPMLRLDEA